MSALAELALRWYRRSARDLPWRRPGVSPWGVLVSEVMLQQTQVNRVEPVFVEWLQRWPTPSDLAREPAGEAIKAWGRLGYPRRALRLHQTARLIVARHDGEVPADVTELERLPGIGTYTARAVAAFAFGQRHPVVDTNVRRLVARACHGVAAAGGSTRVSDLAAVAALLPAEPRRAARASAALMELGALVCTARTPECEACPIASLCRWRSAGRPATAAGPGARRSPGYAGTDRYVRGLLLDLARRHEVVGKATALAAWADREQAERALAGLIEDGLLVEVRHGRYALPEVVPAG
ncbi:MAG TPA: A/G-specific adenine glycosylase [Micromonosporaceae bacterium]|nr:A/G-specific adenine glycosylase [Micromonosporaceae bacterium]